ncbi:hypothetical protein BH11ACT5_BH11ACT5_13810 [soil metagenome]
MTLNSNYPGAVRMAPRGKLEGPERGLDALVRLVILVAELTIGVLSISALFTAGAAAGSENPGQIDQLEAGYGIALFGAAIIFIITTLIYLVRIVVGRRSWPAPLWGTILMSVAIVIGYVVMASAA